MKCLTRGAVLAIGCLMMGSPTLSNSFEEGRQVSSPNKQDRKNRPANAKKSTNAAAKLVPLNQKGTVLLDRSGNRLLLKSKVVLREGMLEMLCCRTQTKEHESILAVDARAYVVHTGLLALRAKPGSPVRFEPKYRPPQGQKIQVFLQWKDPKGKLHRVPGESWVRYVTDRFYGEQLAKRPPDLKIPKRSKLHYYEKFQELSWYGPMTAKQRDMLTSLSQDKAYRKAIAKFFKHSQPRKMDAHWVFAGRGFNVDEKTGQKYYLAEDGDLICVANFPTALLDVSVESGDSNLLFEADTERIPPLDTEVTIELIPLFEKKAEQKKPGQTQRK